MVIVLSLKPLVYAKDTILELSEDEKIFKESVSEYAQKAIAPKWVDIDEEASKDPRNIPLDIMIDMGRQGLYAIPNNPKYGGQGGTYTMTAIAVEEVAYADPSIAIPVYMLLNNGWPFILEQYAREDVAEEVISNVAKGVAFFGIASTEPHGGSDVGGIKTKAEKRNGKYVLNGEKTYISGVWEVQQLPWGGGWFLIARTGGPGHRGLSAFTFLPRKNGQLAPGFHPTIFHDIGRHGLTTGGFILENFELDEKYLIGEENRGFYYVMEGFNAARILVAAACIGASKWLLEQAADWIRSRKLFNGRPISSFQGISFKFSELYAKWEAARYFTYRAARLLDKIYIEKNPAYSPRDLNVPVALAKLWAPETAVEIAQEAMKWLGALSYTKESPVYRVLLGLMSYIVGAEGAQNIMKYIIARDTLGSEYVKG